MDQVIYLTPSLVASVGDKDILYSNLLRQLTAMGQGKAGPEQWSGIIKGLATKGVKQSEIDDSMVLKFLAIQPADQKVTKDQLIQEISRKLPRIKVVTLDKPKFKGYANIDGENRLYQERLYILSSEAMVADDTIEDLLYRIEELGFNPSPLISDPGIVDRLEAEMKELRLKRSQMFDFQAHHFSGIVEQHGKNLFAHSRSSIDKDLFFIEEIQSDWAQKGRKSNWSAAYPKAPLVTNTEQWAGVVLRELLHQAATNPAIKRVAWINSTMRNGWDRSTESESDGLAMFYDTIVRKMAEKCISKAGGRVLPVQVPTKHGTKEVLGFEMTDAVRAALTQSLPMYSRDALLPRGVELADPARSDECAQVLMECKSMLGSAHTIRFVAKLYDAAHTNEISGQYLHKGITLSLRAKHLDRAARHEAWHFAHENLLLAHERREIRLAFAFGGDLNTRTREALLSLGADDAAAQCVNERECAAHAFSLWCEGKLDVSEPKAKNIFEAVSIALVKISDWLEEKVFGVSVQKPEDLFEAMRQGALAVRQSQEAEAPACMDTP